METRALLDSRVLELAGSLAPCAAAVQTAKGAKVYERASAGPIQGRQLILVTVCLPCISVSAQQWPTAEQLTCGER